MFEPDLDYLFHVSFMFLLPRFESSASLTYVAPGAVCAINLVHDVHGGHKRQLIRPRTNNFLSLVWNITKLLHRIELAIPKNPIVFVFRFCYISAGK